MLGIDLHLTMAAVLIVVLCLAVGCIFATIAVLSRNMDDPSR